MGDNAGAYSLFIKSIKNYSNMDPWDIIYAGLAASLTTKLKRPPSQKIDRIYLNLAQLFQNKTNAQTTLMHINKQLINYSGLSISNALFDFMNTLFDSKCSRKWNFEYVGLNSRTSGVEDKHYSPKGSSLVEKIWLNSILPENQESQTDLYLKIFSAINTLKEENFERAYQYLNTPSLADNNAFSDMLLNNLKLQTLHELDRKNETVDFISTTCLNLNNLSSLLPIKSALEDFTFDDFKSKNNHLAGPIALFNLWRRTDSSEILSYLRILTKSSLKSMGVEKPSELTLENSDCRKESLVFFLYHICIPKVIDILRSIRGTKAVMDERQSIYQNLIDLDPDNKNEYSSEMLDIQQELQLSEGQRMVDGTRIYVDMDSLSRWAIVELEEDFNRYKDMLLTNLNEQRDFDDSQVDYSGIDENIESKVSTDNEADALLLSIINKISYEFLTNSSFGLDYYLSKRIRHQSFIGLIRSHYEFSKIVTVRESRDKDYEVNTYWLDKFSTLDNQSKIALNNYLSEFAYKFDELLFYARDKKFHVKTKEQPEGLISIEYSQFLIEILKELLEPQETLKDFVDSLQFVLRAILDRSLEGAREYIANELKNKVANFADQLKANVKKIAGNDPAFVEFQVTLSQKSTEVQHSLDEVIRWFTPLELKDLQRTFSLEQILNIAVNGVLRLHKAFNPIVAINQTMDDEVELHSLSLTLINDTFFILFDNVKEHSGIKEPKISIEVKTSNKYFDLTFISETRASLRKKNEAELDKIREVIAKGNFGIRTTKEGKSGFIKIAATLQQMIGSKLEFGFISDEEFKVEIRYPISFNSALVK